MHNEEDIGSDVELPESNFSESNLSQSKLSVDDDILVLDEFDDPELTLPVWEATGNVVVDQALERIQMLDSSNLESHHEVLTEVHDLLRSAMSDLDR